MRPDSALAVFFLALVFHSCSAIESESCEYPDAWVDEEGRTLPLVGCSGGIGGAGPCQYGIGEEAVYVVRNSEYFCSFEERD